MRSDSVPPPDLGLADVDVGPGPVTMLGLCQLDPQELVAAANAEAVGLWAELEAFCAARKAAHAAALTDQHGGPSDPDAALEAERAAAGAEPDPQTRAAALLLASGGEGSDPARTFPEWEKDVLAARLGISVGQAKRLCRTAVALRDRLPATAQALAAGAISWAHADRLAEHTHRLTPDQSGLVERQVLSDRRTVTPRQYENRARKLASALLPPPDPTDPDESTPASSLLAAQNPWGGVEISATLSDEGGRIVTTALDTLADRTGPDDHRPVDERRADALVELCTWWLERGHTSPSCGGTRPHLSVLTTPDVLAGTSTTTSTLAGAGGLGPVEIDARVAQRIACDAALATLTHDHGQVLDLGRQHRFPTPALRRRLDARDQHCRFPTCSRPARRCHAHHVVWWGAGGETSEQNMILLCHRHHRAVHEGGWSVTFDGRTATWTDPHGRTYDGRAPLADPPDWDGDLPFIQPFEPPRPPPPARDAVPRAFSVIADPTLATTEPPPF